ncbi:MAG TPA: DUF6776 family protein [Marinagarivorans sp.]
MASVKESRQHRMVVVRHRPILQWAIRIIAVAAILASAMGGYHHGYRTGAVQQALLEQMLADHAERVKTLEASNNEMAQQLINTKTGAEVDRKANEAVRQEVLELKTALQKTQEENNFYRNIMSPGKGGKGPALGEWELTPAGAANQYRFKVVAKQLAKHTDWVKGHVAIEISGRQNGKTATYNYSELAVAENGDDKPALKVRFRYFQTLTGTFELPTGFEPSEVAVHLNVSGNKNTTITQSYEWLAN